MCVTAVVKAMLYSANRPIYVAFWRFTTQPIKLQRFVKFCYAVIVHIAFHVYLMTYLLLFCANFQRVISDGRYSKSKRITVLSKEAKHSTSAKSLPVLVCQLFKINYLHTSKNTPFQVSRSNIGSLVRYYNYCDEHWQENIFYLKFTKSRINDTF